MEEKAVVHNTFVIERNYAVPPERVFAAFTDPAKKRIWFAEGHNHDVEAFEMDFRVGGSERVSYRLKPGTPFPGFAISSAGSYQDIVPKSRIVLTSTMTFGEKRISTALVTFEFVAVDGGTDMIFTHQGAFYEGSDGPERREGGWHKLFGKLEEELGRE